MTESELNTQRVVNVKADSQEALTISRVVYRKILLRLFLGWLFLSLTIGGIVLWLEISRFQHFVYELALKESAVLSQASTFDLELLDASASKSLTRQAQQLVNHNFLVVELYDRNKQLKIEAFRQGQKTTEHWTNLHRHTFPERKEFSHEFHLIQGKLLLVILVPIQGSQQSLVGYFEGIYQVNQETQDTITNELLRTQLFIALGITFTTFLMYPVILMLNRELIKLSTDLLTGNLELMNVMGCAIAERDSDTNSHNYRVTFYALRLGEAIGLSRENILNLITGAFLHDVGKIGIRDPILLKPGKLTPQEFEIMKSHVTLGVEILKKSSWLVGACDVVEFHHEKYDGTGYQKGLKGKEIPLHARIFSIADVFDALTSKRPYKESWTVHDAIASLKHQGDSHFDPELLDVFVTMAPDLYQEVNAFDENEMIIMVQRCITHHFLANATQAKPARNIARLE
ncbi:HD-GYP domain-containing protein [Nitrosomonas sp.]|uniref:HD-GYP domain-containing protein n=1 Tax=Nitrosomonas sp. TaxID=42353 RepID=UPI001D7959B1|nr:HD-GYP domain-containing protein [Nitrosomonas sp.]MBX3616301.1 HD-GYP domain-containing protein [Nitrosomonas sp.]